MIESTSLGISRQHFGHIKVVDWYHPKAYLISFKFDNKGPSTYRLVEKMGVNITVKDLEKVQHPLKQKEVHKAKHALGVYLALDDNNKKP